MATAATMSAAKPARMHRGVSMQPLQNDYHLLSVQWVSP